MADFLRTPDRHLNFDPFLLQMDHHLGCVNVVRWSKDGKFLASAGDDKLIMIWQKSAFSGGSIFGGGGKVHVEHWRLHQTLRGKQYTHRSPLR